MSAVPRSAEGRAPGARRPGIAHLHADLRDQIVSVHWKPGAALSEARLALAYGVSRTPVREALRRLADDGLVQVVPQVGTFVAPIDLATVRDNHFVRETLECRIVELAAGRATDADRKALAANLAEQSRAIAAGDAAAFFRADEAMHALLAGIAGHASAWHVIHAAKGQLDRVRRLSLADAGRSRVRLREHRAIVACVARGDAPGALAAMRAHLATIFDAIDRIAAENAHFFIGLPAAGDAARSPRR
jgi:DNA-binding GntR family transcriptional regulator